MEKTNYLKSLVLFLILLLSATASAYDFKVDGIYYNRSGSNAIVTYEKTTYNSYSGDITIPAAVTYDGTTYLVTSIGHSAFFNCMNLTSIEIPNSIISIGSNAFKYCNKLRSITIPKSVTYIDINYVFSECTSLESISVENGNPVYDSRNNCNAIIKTATNTLITGCKSTVIPNTITSIEFTAFNGCRNMANIIIPNSVVNIGDASFQGCSGLVNLTIPNSVTSIGSCAFNSCVGLTHIEIPNSVTNIPFDAFSYCTGLTRIEIGNSVTQIGPRVFDHSTSINDVYSYSITPPVCTENTFSSYSATLHVPAASLAAYFIAPYWENFENIVGDAVAPTAISISNDSIDLQLGEQLQLSAIVTPDNASIKEVTWFSTDTTIATVNDGMVFAVGCGECDIIASCFGEQVMCHVFVGNRIMLDQQEAMLLPNHILTLTPTPTVPDIYIVSSSDPTVAAARVISGGKVQVVGIKEGTTTITVNSADGTAIPATCLVTVYTEPGDLNSDGFVNISDVTSLIDYLLGGEDSSVTIKNADVNDDGNINISDVTSLIDTLLGETE